MTNQDEMQLTRYNQVFDINTIRKDFPSLTKFQAYLDTAFIGLMPSQVMTAHQAYLDERFQFGPMPLDKTILAIWMGRRDLVRRKLAAFLGAKENEIAFTLCTGCGINTAVNGLNWQQGENVVTDDLEYPTDLHVIHALRAKGIEVRIARHNKGSVSTEQIDALIDSKTRAVVVSHVSYLNGYRHDLRKIADIIHNRGGYLIVDGSQSIGGIRVNIKDEQVDVMAGIPYKWLTGPNGLGFFYIREELIPLIAPDRLGWSSFDGFESLETFESKPSPDTAKRYEYGTLSFEGIYALDAALDYFNQIGIEHIEQRNLRLIDLARSRLCEKGYKLLTPLHNQSPILSFFTDDEQAFARQMKAKGFYVTAGRRAEGYIRISPHFYNTEEEINTFVHALPDL